MHGAVIDPHNIVKEYVDESVIRFFKAHGKTEEFIFNYLANAVLSCIESKEQVLILEMKYDSWVNVKLDELIDKINEFIERFFKAYGEAWGGQVFKEGAALDCIAAILFYLYERGIYGDGISRFLMLRGFTRGDPYEFIRRNLEMGTLELRSRFIEIAFYLARVRQRFPDTSIYVSTPLVSRVFAYAIPRELPVGVEEIDGEFLKRVESKLTRALDAFLKIMGYEGGAPEQPREMLRRCLQAFFNEFKKWYGEFRFYRFQVEGIEAILESVEQALNRKSREVVLLEAPTGAGKTEVFVLASILLIMAYKCALLAGRRGGGSQRGRSPLVIILYPRRALATDQVRRVIRYVYIYNKAVEGTMADRRISEGLKIAVSMDYAEVRYIRELWRKLGEKLKSGEISGTFSELDLRYVKVRVRREGGYVVVELPYLYSPRGNGFLRVKLPERILKLPIRALEDPWVIDQIKESLKRLWWNNERIDFIRAFKDLVYEEPGDIHITLFESLRRDLLKSRARRLFGERGMLGPLLFVIDEVHLNVGIYGARVAFLLDRVLARVRSQTGYRDRGAVFVSLSATVPQAEKFIKNFFGVWRDRSIRIVRVNRADTIPMGGEYLYIIVPATGVDMLSVSIQSIMVLHFNMPAYVIKHPLKKTLVFADNLDVVARLHHDLEDALNIGRRALLRGDYGLQDLRNPVNEIYRHTTLSDFPARLSDLEEVLKKLSGFENLRAWLEGELWWPYALEYGRGWHLVSTARYTGREKHEISDKHIVITDSALEVGVNYDDVVVIYQHGMPLSISALIQRAGRSGRIMRGNPLVRAAIAVMLSPYVPTQAALLEMLLRARSIRDLLKRERLLLATNNTAVIEQNVVEAVLDYITMNFPESNGVLFLRDLRGFECSILHYLRDRSLTQYLVSVFKERFDHRKAEEYVSKTLEKLEDLLADYCKSSRV